MTDEHLIPVRGVRMCGLCNTPYGVGTKCLCTVTVSSRMHDERGDELMRDFKFPCPHCGGSHMMIPGATVVSDKNGGLMAVCPQQKKGVNNGK